MKAVLLALAVTLATLQSPPQANPPAPLDAALCKCSIEVTLKRKSTGEPISNVQVSLSQADQVGANGLTIEGFLATQAALQRMGVASVVTSTTDADGFAVFQDLPEGVYRIQAEREGYFSEVSDRIEVAASVIVSVGPANPAGPSGTPRKPVQQVTLNLLQAATITGRVTDGNNRPVAAVQVGAFRSSYTNGNRVLTELGRAAQTDDRGEYRLYWFQPGEIYVRVGGRGAVRSAVQPGNRGAGTLYPIASYYPGTMDPKSAIPVVVAEGSHLTGIDIDMKSGTGVTVSGSIVNTIPGGRIDSQGRVERIISSVFLVPRDSYFFEEAFLVPNAAAAVRLDRAGALSSDSVTEFEIRGVPPGSYDFYPIYNDGSNVAIPGGGIPGYYSSRTPIEVGTQDVIGIQSVIRPGSNLRGHITIAGTAPAAQAGPVAQPIQLANLRLQVESKDNLPVLVRGGRGPYPVDVDGLFSMANVVNARYYISAVNPLPPDAYVSEIRSDSRDVFDDGYFAVGEGTQSTLEVVISRGGGTIQGIVKGLNQSPVSGVTVTLIPDKPRRQNVLLYKNANSDSTGAFTLTGIAPGSYKLFAWEKLPSTAERNPDFIRDYDELGTVVSVSAGLPLMNVQVPVTTTKR